MKGSPGIRPRETLMTLIHLASIHMLWALGALKRNCRLPVFSKNLGPKLASPNIFGYPLLVTQKSETPPPYPSAFYVLEH